MLLIMVIPGLVVTSCATDSASSGPRVGNLAPDFELRDLDGETVSLRGLRGSPVMLNFWATWCPPCRAEMPYLQEIYEQWTSQGLVLLAINLRESSSQVKGFLQSYGLSFPVLLDSTGSVGNKYNISGIPATFFIDKDGIIQGIRVGAFPNKEAIEEYLDEIIP